MPAAVESHVDEDTVGILLTQAMPFLDDPILGAIVPWFLRQAGQRPLDQGLPPGFG